MTQSSPVTITACVAGTASSQPFALWQLWTQAQAAELLSAAECASTAIALTHWTAPAATDPLVSAMPAGPVFWLPTPANATPNEYAAEMVCRQQLMHATMNGHTHLRVLYGPPEQQLRALQECLLAMKQEAINLLNSSPALLPDADAVSRAGKLAAAHGHAAYLRCRECVDPASEQRLFSRLLAGTGVAAPHKRS